MKKIPRLLLSATFLLPASLGYGVDRCFQMAENLKEKLGISGEYDPRLRVERKTTNTVNDATVFLDFINRVIRPSKGESIVLRDVASDPSQVLVTSTNYPFSKEILSRFNIKVRVREYGQRAKGTSDPFQSTTGEFVSLEIKAKLPIEGVVVKPILRISKTLLPDLFTSPGRFQSSKTKIIEAIIESNPKLENAREVVTEVVEQISILHQAEAAAGRIKIPCQNVEYQRNGYVLEVAGADGALRKVQLTFDRAVSLRENTDAFLSPSEIGRQAASARYPPDSVVIEMKTDLLLNENYVKNGEGIREEFPSYYLIRRVYEQLQALTLDGFEADSGKAAHFRRNTVGLQQFVHFMD